MGAIPACCHSSFSFWCVPDSSPRETKGACAAAIFASASAALFAVAHTGRIVLRTENDEIVVHDIPAVDAEAFGDKLVLQFAGMHQDHIDVAGLAEFDRLAGADGDDIDLDAVGLLEGGQQFGEQSGILGGGGGRQAQPSFGNGAAGEERGADQGNEQNAYDFHDKPPLVHCRAKSRALIAGDPVRIVDGFFIPNPARTAPAAGPGRQRADRCGIRTGDALAAVSASSLRVRGATAIPALFPGIDADGGPMTGESKLADPIDSQILSLPVRGKEGTLFPSSAEE